MVDTFRTNEVPQMGPLIDNFDTTITETKEGKTDYTLQQGSVLDEISHT